ncbi:purine-nucleoside phosphorylase [Verrucomicrobiales bacterium]|nr:purine-nucleoside phosphorylase [Verrucomicrobiales bacterium]
MTGDLSAFKPVLGIVLGSGLSGFTDLLHVTEKIGYHELPGMPESTVPGHDGAFLFAKLADRDILVASGRNHLYEGHSARAATEGIRFMYECGVKTLVLTNAAGTLNNENKPGEWMAVSDHINLTGKSPFKGGPNFHDMSEIYSPALREKLATAARKRKFPLHEGVYAAVPGPQYETPAEVRMIRGFGADAVGMSTVHEAMQAKALGMEVAALSCLTNWGAGMPGATLDHEDVLAMGDKASAQLGEMVAAIAVDA